MGYTARFRVWRGSDADGELHDFDVEVNDGEVVLDVIHRLQATQAQDLAVRWNCKAGKCGSCSAEINGRPRLLCMTRMNTFDQAETVTVTPLRAFPVIRDLVTDVSFNYQKAREVPSFTPPPGLKAGDYRMEQVDVERSQEFRKCIECFLCQDTCHVIRDHEENKPVFAGPRFFIRIAELDMHPLDTLERKHSAQEEFGLGYCNITKCCTEVCPEGIHITDNAIIPMKERVVDTKYDPAFGLFRVLKARSKSTKLMNEQSDRAWTLLRSVEDGDADYASVADQVAQAMQQAKAVASTGTVLARLEALDHFEAGRLEEAAESARTSLSWHRSAQEQSDAWVTLARVYDAQERAEATVEAVDHARRFWPDNPRLRRFASEVRSP
jgi:succinate dehydrogenase / fumarate reductase, iron-sulfur subunit